MLTRLLQLMLNYLLQLMVNRLLRLRRSFTNASTFVDLDKTSYQEPARHSSFVGKNYNVHPYVNQFPKIFHCYITHAHDVIEDGNCGFRAIAVWLGLHEGAWSTIQF